MSHSFPFPARTLWRCLWAWAPAVFAIYLSRARRMLPALSSSMKLMLWAARQNRKFVMMSDFEMSKDKVLMGVERKSMILSDEEKKNTAYHEAGHALVAAMTPGADPVHKVTIIPRGMALGLTMQLPEDDKHTYTRGYLETMLAVLMGGRSAEEIFLGHITTGAGNDIERATEIARNMVCEWGMSELGPLAFGKKDEAIFLGREINQHRDYSEDTAILIDKEVRRIVNGGYDQAKNILANNKEVLERIAQALLEREVIDANEGKLLMEGKPQQEKPRTPPPPVQAAPSSDPKIIRTERRPAHVCNRGGAPVRHRTRPKSRHETARPQRHRRHNGRSRKRRQAKQTKDK